MDFTYRELLQQLRKLDENTLDQSVTVFLTETDEYYPLEGFARTNDDGTDVLDDNSFLLVVNG